MDWILISYTIILAGDFHFFHSFLNLNVLIFLREQLPLIMTAVWFLTNYCTEIITTEVGVISQNWHRSKLRKVENAKG